MKKTALFALAVLTFVSFGALYAQDEGTSGSDFNSFFESSESGGEASPALSINGQAEVSARAYLSEDSISAIFDAEDETDATEVDASLSLDLEYEKDNSEISATLNVDPSVFDEYPEDVLEELAVTLFVGDITLDAGKMKVVWGRGDNLHVLDPFNANDYSDFLMPDYIDRRIAEPMVKLGWAMPSNMKLELIWTPSMTADRNPTEGYWASSEAQSLVELGTSYVTYQAATAYTAAGGDAAGTLSMLDVIDSTTVESMLPDTFSLDYGQYGVRWTAVAGPVDVGAEYYLGHYKTPSWSYTTAGGYITSLDLTYDKLQIFGIDAAGVLGPFNLRAEAAYYLTDDVEGDDAAVHNNSLQWLGGFDIDLPISNMNLNTQVIGSYVLGNDNITIASDVDYNSRELWTNDKLVLKLTDSYKNEKIEPSITTIWGIEQRDLFIRPELQFNLRDDFTISCSGAYIYSDDGEFEAYEDSNFAEVSVSYSF